MSFSVVHFEARRYWVQSAPGRPENLVDLEENDGAGECSCEDHRFRIQPVMTALLNANQGTAPEGADPRFIEGQTCKHIRAARTFEMGGVPA